LTGLIAAPHHSPMDRQQSAPTSPHRTWKSGSFEPVERAPLRVTERRRERTLAKVRLKRVPADPRLPHALRRG